MSEEELFFEYQQKSRKLEELREDYERRKRKCEEKRGQIQEWNVRERAQIEDLVNAWGNCPDSNALLSSFEEFVEEQEQIQRQKEDELQKEGRQVRNKMEQCDFWYEEERWKLEEETEWE